MEGRIAQLSVMLERAEIVEVDASLDEVQAGHLVSIMYRGDDESETYLIGSIEEKRDGVDVISPGSPIGSALLGARVGDHVSFEAPGGQLSVEVISIDL